jgi:hypothetical protein
VIGAFLHLQSFQGGVEPPQSKVLRTFINNPASRFRNFPRTIGLDVVGPMDYATGWACQRRFKLTRIYARELKITFCGAMTKGSTPKSSTLSTAPDN